MMYKDDDDQLPSLSTSDPEYFSSANRERRALEKKMESHAKQEGKTAVVKLGTEMELKQLEAQFSGQKDDEKKRKEKQDDDAKNHQTFGTKTLKQEQESKVMTADTTLTHEQMIDNEEAQRNAKDESQEEMTAGPG